MMQSGCGSHQFWRARPVFRKATLPCLARSPSFSQSRFKSSRNCPWSGRRTYYSVESIDDESPVIADRLPRILASDHESMTCAERRIRGELQLQGNTDQGAEADECRLDRR